METIGSITPLEGFCAQPKTYKGSLACAGHIVTQIHTLNPQANKQRWLRSSCQGLNLPAVALPKVQVQLDAGP